MQIGSNRRTGILHLSVGLFINKKKNSWLYGCERFYGGNHQHEYMYNYRPISSVWDLSDVYVNNYRNTNVMV